MGASRIPRTRPTSSNTVYKPKLFQGRVTQLPAHNAGIRKSRQPVESLVANRWQAAVAVNESPTLKWLVGRDHRSRAVASKLGNAHQSALTMTPRKLPMCIETRVTNGNRLIAVSERDESSLPFSARRFSQPALPSVTRGGTTPRRTKTNQTCQSVTEPLNPFEHACT